MKNIQHFKDKSIYIAPKNKETQELRDLLFQNGFNVKLFIDNFKKGSDIFKDNLFTDEDIVIIYSPNYYKDIINTLNTKAIYILKKPTNTINFEIIENSSFKGYEDIKKVNQNFNSFEAQKEFWEKHLKDSFLKDTTLKEYGYSWGEPENNNDILGNYLSIKNELLELINTNSTVLELGTLGGKWTQYLLDANKIICVDINSFFIEVIQKRFKHYNNKFQFYISKGNELSGIPTHSINLIFCIDTLVRVEKESIFAYIKEFSRVLKPNGQAIIHLPNSDIASCQQRDFTDISTHDIQQEFEKYFSLVVLDSTTITHGTLVKINI